MIRPLIQAIYDYRMAFHQETNPTLRNNYKIHYVQASTILACENIFDKINSKKLSLEDAIDQWNNQPKQEVPETRDYKTRLDDIFISKNKNYFRKDERSLSKEKGEDFRQTNRTNQQYSYHRPKEHGNNFQHKYSDYSYKEQGTPYHNQKDNHNVHNKQGGYRQNYGQRYRNDRY